jgi:hypothetical protein
MYSGSKNPESAEMLLRMLNGETEIIVRAELSFALSKLSFPANDDALKTTVLKKMFLEIDTSVELRLAWSIFTLRQGYEVDLAKKTILNIFHSKNVRYPFSYLLRPGSESSVTTLLLEFQRLSSQRGGFAIDEIDSGLLKLLSQLEGEISDKITIEVVITYAHYGDWRLALGFFDRLSIGNKRRIIETAFSSENIDSKTFRGVISRLFSLYDQDLKIDLLQLLRDNGVAVDEKLKQMFRGDLGAGNFLNSLEALCEQSRNPFMRRALDKLNELYISANL